MNDLLKQEVIDKWELTFSGITRDIQERLQEYEGNETYVSEVGYLITESENANGCWEIYTANNKALFLANYDLFCEVYEGMEDPNNSFNILNGDIDFVVCGLMLEMYSQIVAEAIQDTPLADEDELLLDENNVNLICGALAELVNPFDNLKE